MAKMWARKKSITASHIGLETMLATNGQTIYKLYIKFETRNSPIKAFSTNRANRNRNVLLLQDWKSGKIVMPKHTCATGTIQTTHWWVLWQAVSELRIWETKITGKWGGGLCQGEVLSMRHTGTYELRGCIVWWKECESEWYWILTALLHEPRVCSSVILGRRQENDLSTELWRCYGLVGSHPQQKVQTISKQQVARE